MADPLWDTVPKAIRWFNYTASVGKCWRESLRILMGLRKSGDSVGNVILTCSISEDYARLWLYFARTSLDMKKWHFLIVDSSGAMRKEKFHGADIVKFVNLYHGRKVDVILRRVILADIVFLCDDDKFILSDPTDQVYMLRDPRTAAVSFCPRNWWRFRIGNDEFVPMGSYAILFNRRLFLNERLRFQSPRAAHSSHKVFCEGVKKQLSYDTADYANEQLLLRGYRVNTLPRDQIITGFDGLTAPRVLLMKYGKRYVKRALLEARHWKEGSTNGAVMKGLYGIVKVERLYRHVFGCEPVFPTGFSEEELMDICLQNSHVDAQDREQISAYYIHLDTVAMRLSTHSGQPRCTV